MKLFLCQHWRVPRHGVPVCIDTQLQGFFSPRARNLHRHFVTRTSLQNWPYHCSHSSNAWQIDLLTLLPCISLFLTFFFGLCITLTSLPLSYCCLGGGFLMPHSHHQQWSPPPSPFLCPLCLHQQWPPPPPPPLLSQTSPYSVTSTALVSCSPQWASL